jgi:hypothetical protein
MYDADVRIGLAQGILVSLTVAVRARTSHGLSVEVKCRFPAAGGSRRSHKGCRPRPELHQSVAFRPGPIRRRYGFHAVLRRFPCRRAGAFDHDSRELIPLTLSLTNRTVYRTPALSESAFPHSSRSILKVGRRHALPGQLHKRINQVIITAPTTSNTAPIPAGASSARRPSTERTQSALRAGTVPCRRRANLWTAF